jgi:hypothetical protein
MPSIDVEKNSLTQHEIKPGYRCLSIQQRLVHPSSAPLLPQNAGCLMAVHANCTKTKNKKNRKSLILKDFI